MSDTSIPRFGGSDSIRMAVCERSQAVKHAGEKADRQTEKRSSVESIIDIDRVKSYKSLQVHQILFEIFSIGVLPFGIQTTSVLDSISFVSSHEPSAERIWLVRPSMRSPPEGACSQIRKMFVNVPRIENKPH
jgi:hypothetical protein